MVVELSEMGKYANQRTLVMKVLNILGILVIYPFFIYSQQSNFNSYSQELPNVKNGIDMVAISGGIFKMGNPSNLPKTIVKLDSFWIGKYEIPWGIYELFVFESIDITDDGKKDRTVDAVTRPTPPYLDMTFGMGKDSFPAVGMTQYNAIQFCKWLYLRTGIFFRLPTEAEWEYACKAGSETAYFFGNSDVNADEYAWFINNSDGKTHPIGTKKPNAWGIYDMTGNVTEWTDDQYIIDFYSQFSGKIANNPVAVPKQLYPISIRGGSFKDSSEKLESGYRSGSDPSWKIMDPQIPKSNWWFPEAPFIGFRIVRPIKSPTKEDIKTYYNRAPIADY